MVAFLKKYFKVNKQCNEFIVVQSLRLCDLMDCSTGLLCLLFLGYY